MSNFITNASILLFAIYSQIYIINCDVPICYNKCYCENRLINNLPLVIIKCNNKNLMNVFDIKYDAYELDFSYNYINALSATLDAQDLIVLDLSYNEITTIRSNYFNQLNELIVLNLSHNKLKTIDVNLFKQLTKLQRLFLQYNELKSLPDNLLLPLRNLLRIDLSYNIINGTIIDDRNGRSRFLLDSIGLTRNITHLTLNNVFVNDVLHDRRAYKHFNNLQELSITDNNLNDVPILTSNDLIKLDLSGNNFNELKANDFYHKNLKVLNLNRLKNLTNIHHYAFYSLQSLEELYIENCPKLRIFSDVVFEDVIDNDVRLPLKRLSLNGCGLEMLNRTYLNLIMTIDKIDLQNNPWKCNCDISWFKMIRKDKMIGEENTL